MMVVTGSLCHMIMYVLQIINFFFLDKNVILDLPYSRGLWEMYMYQVIMCVCVSCVCVFHVCVCVVCVCVSCVCVCVSCVCVCVCVSCVWECVLCGVVITTLRAHETMADRDWRFLL